jgi:hypothetical protein
MHGDLAARPRWTADAAGLSEAQDDVLTVYGDDKRAVVITHDVEFSKRRRKNVIGQHLWLRCIEPEATALLRDHLDGVLTILANFDDVFIEVSKQGLQMSHKWS